MNAMKSSSSKTNSMTTLLLINAEGEEEGEEEEGQEGHHHPEAEENGQVREEEEEEEGSATITSTGRQLDNNCNRSLNNNTSVSSPQVPSDIDSTTNPLTTRCVIIQRDEKGFGLRVSGDNPVFVESVKQDGAAYRSGVRPGDRIIKVNGTLVTKHGHQEVVKLIQGTGSYVALTLLGLKMRDSVCAGGGGGGVGGRESLSPGERRDSDGNGVTGGGGGGRASLQGITAPLPAHETTIREFERSKEKTILAMIEAENKHLETMRREAAGIKEIESTVKRIATLKKQLSVLGKEEDGEGAKAERGSGGNSGRRRRSLHHLSAENLTSSTTNEMNSGGQVNKKSHSFGQFDNSSRASGSNNNIITMESDEEEDYEENVKNLNKFEAKKSLSLVSLTEDYFLLKLLHFILEKGVQKHDHDANCLFFFCLLSRHIDSKEGKETKEHVFELHSTFLLPDSPLNFMEVKEDSLNLIYDWLNSKHGAGGGEERDNLRSKHVLTELREEAGLKVSQMLAEYQKQAEMGLVRPSLPTINCLIDLVLGSQTLSSHGLWVLLDKLTSGQMSTSNYSEMKEYSSHVAKLIALTSLLYHFYPNFLPSLPVQQQSSIYPQFILCFHPHQLNKSSKKASSPPSVLSPSGPPPPPPPPPLPPSLGSSPSPSCVSSSHPLLVSSHTFIVHQHKPSSPYSTPSSGASSTATSSITYCSGCGHVIWGKSLFSLKCVSCLLVTHYWCLKKIREDFPPCPFPVKKNSASSLPKKTPSQTKSFVDNILKKTGLSSSSFLLQQSDHSFHKQDSHELATPPLLLLLSSDSSSRSSSISSTPPGSPPPSYDIANLSSLLTSNPLLASPTQPTAAATPTATATLSSPPTTVTITRSESLKSKRRRRRINKDRKKSDPSHLSSGQYPSCQQGGDGGHQPRRSLSSCSTLSRKQLDVCREFIKTEKTHLRNLNILHSLFYLPIKEEALIPTPVLSQIFGNHFQLLTIHSNIYAKLKTVFPRKRHPKEGKDPPDLLVLARVLVEVFEGKELEEGGALFCGNQSQGATLLRKLIRKESKLSTFLIEAEAHPLCKRLQLKDLLASCFQRITKYPLLLESLLKTVSVKEKPVQKETKGEDVDAETAAGVVAEDEDDAEQKQVEEARALLELALKRSKDILLNVNQKVKEEENKQRLTWFQKRIDFSSFASNMSASFASAAAGGGGVTSETVASMAINLGTTQRLIFEGNLIWRITKQKQIDVHVLLLSSYLLILTREGERDKFLLKHQPNPITKLLHSPLLKVDNLLTRNVATDKTAFFLVSTHENAVYEFAASSSSERNQWCDAIGGASGSGGITPPTQLKDLTEQQHHNRDQSVVGPVSPSAKEGEGRKVEEKEGVIPEKKVLIKENAGGSGERNSDALPATSPSGSRSPRIEGTIRFVSKEEEEEEEVRLVDPCQVTTSDPRLVVEEAVVVLSKEQQVKQINERIQLLLRQRSRLLTDDQKNDDDLEGEEKPSPLNEFIYLSLKLLDGTRYKNPDDESLRQVNDKLKQLLLNQDLL